MNRESLTLLVRHDIRRTWLDELDDAIRGIASGFLIGIPVVVTVDSWWLGEQIGPLDALILIGFAYALTVAAVYWIGFRRRPRHGWEYFADALEALTIAVVALVVVFWALGQLSPGQAWAVALGRISVAIAPFSLGVAVANHLLPRDATRYDPDEGDATALRVHKNRMAQQTVLFELAASVAGALFLCLTIVPVDDLSSISVRVPLENLPWVIFLSLVVSYSVVFAAGFTGERDRHAQAGPLQHPFTETVLAYFAALIVSVGVLWLFGRVAADSPPLEIYIKTVLLAFPASMAAAAGRLAV